MDIDTLRALLAGLASGIAVSFATTAIVLVALVRSPYWAQRRERQRVPLPLLGIAAVNLALLGWTAVGLVLGALFLRAESTRPGGGLASPNWLFTLLVLAVTGAALGVASFVRGRLTWPMWSTALVALLGFGWMLPNLAR